MARDSAGLVCSDESCGSRRIEEGEDGFFYCHRGHRQAVRNRCFIRDLSADGARAKYEVTTTTIMSRASGRLPARRMMLKRRQEVPSQSVWLDACEAVNKLTLLDSTWWPPSVRFISEMSATYPETPAVVLSA